jgi:hypothetical protein
MHRKALAEDNGTSELTAICDIDAYGAFRSANDLLGTLQAVLDNCKRRLKIYKSIS